MHILWQHRLVHSVIISGCSKFNLPWLPRCDFFMICRTVFGRFVLVCAKGPFTGHKWSVSQLIVNYER